MNVSIAETRPLFRYAPTPSGYLHAGNLSNFLLIWILARANEAHILLRIDDLDRERYRSEYTEDIFRKLEILDLDYEKGPKDLNDFEKNWTQQHRQSLYLTNLQTLIASDSVYVCECSRKDIEHGKKCTCLYPKSLDDRRPWRVRTETACKQHWKDQLRGGISILPQSAIPNFIIRKNNGSPSYQLASVLDDLYFGVTDIVRGEDLLASTSAQLLIAGIAGKAEFCTTRFYHHPLIQSKDGMKLSKSAGDQIAISTALKKETIRQIVQEVAVWLNISHDVTTKEELLTAFLETKNGVR